MKFKGIDWTRRALEIVTAGFWIAVIMASGAVAGSSSSEVATPNVVVTIKPIHGLVTGVMDGVGKPKLLVEGAQSPHGFALKPSGARSISNADVFIYVSETVEPFVEKVRDVLPQGATVVELIDTDGLNLLKQRAGATFERHDHNAHDDHKDAGEHGEAHEVHDEHDDVHAGHADMDGHIWLDPDNAKVIVQAIAATLGKRWPEHAAKFDENAQAVIARLDQLTGAIETSLAPVKGRPFIVFHDAFQYFEKRFGLSAAGAVTLNPEVPPGAKRLSKLRATIKSLNAQCMFAEPQFGARVLRSVREGTGARSGVLDPIGADLEPGADLYFNLLRGLADDMRACLAGS